jgi:hypothetical protein
MARKPPPPKELTSTSAFRAYLKAADQVADDMARGARTEDQALAEQRALSEVLTRQLGRLFQQRLRQSTAEQAEPPRIETYPVPRLRDLAEGSSYVHRAHFPPADQGGPAAGPTAAVEPDPRPRPPGATPADSGHAGGGE